jgi:hypothetical protein
VILVSVDIVHGPVQSADFDAVGVALVGAMPGGQHDRGVDEDAAAVGGVVGEDYGRVLVSILLDDDATNDKRGCGCGGGNGGSRLLLLLLLLWIFLEKAPVCGGAWPGSDNPAESQKKRAAKRVGYRVSVFMWRDA